MHVPWSPVTVPIIYSVYEWPLHNTEVNFKAGILGDTGGHKCFYHLVPAEWVGVLSHASWALLRCKPSP